MSKANPVTSKKVASTASKVLQGNYSKAAKSAAGAALSGARGGSKGGGGKKK